MRKLEKNTFVSFVDRYKLQKIQMQISFSFFELKSDSVHIMEQNINK